MGSVHVIPGADQLMLLTLGFAFAAIILVTFNRWPRIATAAFIAAIAVVPYWAGVTLKAYVPPASLVSILILVALVPWRGFRPHFLDLIPLSLAALLVLATVTGVSYGSINYTFATEWLAPYLAARVLVPIVGFDWILGAVTIAMTAAAVLALVEAVSGVNFFVSLGPRNYLWSAWHGIQIRGGEARTEGAFGHSIALGSSLAASIPLALGSRFRPALKTATVTLLLAATVTTYSRLGMTSAVLGLVLSLIFMRSSISLRGRVIAVAALLAAAVMVLPRIMAVFLTAGTEASGSAGYRVNLLSLVDSMSPVGLSPTFERGANGDVFFSRFQSIDSALILLGLRQGWVAVLIVGVGLILALVATLTWQANPATISMVALIPSFIGVALITQYGAFVWFIAGLAVAGVAHSVRSNSLDNTVFLPHTPSKPPSRTSVANR